MLVLEGDNLYVLIGEDNLYDVSKPGENIVKKISRQEAKNKGLKHYFTGAPCPRGHYAPRFTSVGTCTTCGKEKAMERHVHTTSKRRAYNDFLGFTVAASEVHNGKYKYPPQEYKGAHTKVDIVCALHGVFTQSPTNHVQGKGCPKCAGLAGSLRCRKKLSQFVKEASKMWPGQYDYHNVIYKGAKQKVSITCKLHGDFLQTPTNHLSYKQGCPQCNHMKSQHESAIAQFLAIFTPVVSRDRSLIAPKEIDIYLPEHNLAVEYCGEYWHMHKDADDEKKNKNRHYDKHKACEAQGVRLVTMYETEYLRNPTVMKRILRNAIGKSKGKLMARKCELRKVTTQEAKPFYDKYHPQGGTGAGEHYALFWKDKMVACMRFTKGSNDRGNNKNRVWTLSRYATRLNVAGAASRLFKAFRKEYNPPTVKSFSDNRYFGGGMYEALGFVLEAEVAPDYTVFHPKTGLLPKPHWQRRVIPKRLEQVGVDAQFDPKTDPRTEKEMTYLAGAGRIYDCGKKRWVWHS